MDPSPAKIVLITGTPIAMLLSVILPGLDSFSDHFLVMLIPILGSLAMVDQGQNQDWNIQYAEGLTWVQQRD